MQTHVEFRSSKFPAYPGEEDEVNPGLWGKRLAEYLRDRLREHGTEVDEIYSEDWGWAVPIKNEGFPLWVGCGHYQEHDDGYLVFIEPSKPVIRRGLFRKVDTTVAVGRVAQVLDKILSDEPEIREMRWWAEDER